ncbi:HD domain protein [uncultured archaeon]|nr:HD domain protein [uncultured archaeon]
MTQLIEKAKKAFLDGIKEYGQDPYGLMQHVTELERWAKLLLKKYPEADSEVVLLGVWLHDFGHYQVNPDEDHAITSERKAKKLLGEEKMEEKRLGMVLHCVRSHRCRDVAPKTIEARILACADSVSHMTDTVYLEIARSNKLKNYKYSSLEKLERDYRDASIFPEIKKEITPLYNAWKALLEAYSVLDY